MDQSNCVASRHREPRNKGKLAGQKAPLHLKEIHPRFDSTGSKCFIGEDWREKRFKGCCL
jgi:hypothetical protein